MRVLFIATVILFLMPFSPLKAEKLLSGEVVGSQSPLPITMKEALAMAIENNLQAKIDRDTALIGDLNFKISKGVYAPTIGLESYYQNEVLPVASAIAGGVGNDSVTNESWVANAFLRGDLPFGTHYEANFRNQELLTDNVFQFLVPQYTSSLEVSLRQPLLKNFWMNDNRKNIKVQKVNSKITDIDFKISLQTLVYNTQKAFLDLALAAKSVEINNQSVELAREQLHRNERLGEIGKAPKIDAVSAKAELEKRIEELKVSEEALIRAQNTLKTLILGSSYSPLWKEKYQASYEQAVPEFTLKPIDSEIQVANSKRLEFKKVEDKFAIKQIERKYLINQGLPQVDVVTSYIARGLAGSPQDNAQQVGSGRPIVIAPQFVGDYVDNLQNLINNDYVTFKVGVDFSWPVAPGTTMKILKKNDLELEQIKLEEENLKQTVMAEVMNAYGAAQLGQERVDAAKKEVESSKVQLKGEMDKYKIGLTTNFLVLTRQNDLSQAELRLARAITDSNKALSELKKATGVILEENNIELVSVAKKDYEMKN